jgi:hypothetical protein
LRFSVRLQIGSLEYRGAGKIELVRGVK